MIPHQCVLNGRARVRIRYDTLVQCIWRIAWRLSSICRIFFESKKLSPLARTEATEAMGVRLIAGCISTREVERK